MKTSIKTFAALAIACLFQSAAAECVISGKAFGENGTTPIQDVKVELYWIEELPEYNTRRHYRYGDTTTDSTGSYAFSIPSGYWVVYFSKSIDVEDCYDYYHNKNTIQTATPIILNEGENATDINGYVYTRRGSISGKVTGPDGVTPLRRIAVVAQCYNPAYGRFSRVASGNTDDNGFYQVNGIPEGNCKIIFYDMSGVYKTEYHNNTEDENSAELITVTRARETPDINASLDYQDGQGPEIVVEHPLDTVLEDGQGSVSFGNGNVGIPVARTLTIRNTGTAALTGITAEVRGTHASDFTADAPGSQTLAPGEETTLSVRFTPSATGPRSATLGVLSNDADESPFEISLSGGGLSPKQPEIVVQQGTGMNKNLTDNKSKRGFGSVKTGRKSKPMVFVIRNTGKSTLKKIAISLGGRNADDFRIVEVPRKSIDPGKSTEFAVQYKPRKQRTSSALLVIANNDTDENPFRVRLSGRGVP